MTLIKHKDLIEETIDLLVPTNSSLQKELFDAARYSLFSGGKRIRPRLVMATVESFKGDIASSCIPSCAIELVHTYSLIHDDLPCMDNDRTRRGKPTVHVAFSPHTALLAGDFLLTLAFEALATAPLLSAEQKIELIKVLAQSSGGSGMIGGQTLDLGFEGKNTSFETLKTIHLNKTAALFTACFLFGGIIARVSSEELLLLQKIGQAFGFAYQVLDDLEDAMESSSDQSKQKATAVSVLGLKKAQNLYTDLKEETYTTLSSLSNPLPLKDLIQKLLT